MTRPVRPGYLKNLFPAAAPAGNTDPYRANVVLQAGNESGADGGTTFLDQSSYARTLTAVGNAQWDTAQAPTGLTSSILFDGTGDMVTAADSDDFSFASPFCIEGFIRVPSTSGARGAITKWNNGSFPGSSFAFYHSGTTLLWQVPRQSDGYWDGGNGPAGDPRVNITGTFAVDTWYHVALDWDGSTYRAWQAGAAMGTPVSRTTGMFNSTITLGIGGFPTIGGTASWNGWIASVRLTNASRYTSAFTPPTLPMPTS